MSQVSFRNDANSSTRPLPIIQSSMNVVPDSRSMDAFCPTDLNQSIRETKSIIVFIVDASGRRLLFAMYLSTDMFESKYLNVRFSSTSRWILEKRNLFPL